MVRRLANRRAARLRQTAKADVFSLLSQYGLEIRSAFPKVGQPRDWLARWVTLWNTGPADVAILGGAEVEGSFPFFGPLVMDTPERLTQAKRDFAEGRMGRLDGVPF